MKNLLWYAITFKSVVSKVVITLTVASVLCLLSIPSAFADCDNGHGGKSNGHNSDDRGYNFGFRQGYQQPYRYGYGYQQQPYGYRYGYRQPYNYAQPVYVPPPVYYGPMQSPGISLFFPLNLHR